MLVVVVHAYFCATSEMPPQRLSVPLAKRIVIKRSSMNAKCIVINRSSMNVSNRLIERYFV
jgi:hypothetical protein